MPVFGKDGRGLMRVEWDWMGMYMWEGVSSVTPYSQIAGCALTGI